MKELKSIILALAGIIFASLIVSVPIWMLWNECLVGSINGISEISWGQSFGIIMMFGFFNFRIYFND